jgi:16S rRNA (uracil1498-N3)-methyltransferase
MRVTRVHVDAHLAPDSALQLPSGAAQHLARVLRLGPGASLRLFNGRGGEHAAVIDAVHRDQVTVRVGAHDPVERESPLKILLLQGLARGEKMDLVLQKATELGVAAIVPVQMARSTVRLDERQAEAKRRHWQSVVISACEQCGRNTVPEVSLPQTFGQALSVSATHKLILAPDESAQGLAQWPATAAGPGPHYALLVGPEGGFDSAESGAAAAAGFVTCRLGPRVLRTETAGLATLAILQSLAGDLR